MKIAWILDVAEENGRLRAPSASVRYRGLLPAKALEASGCVNTFIPMWDVCNGNLHLDHDALVLGKMFPLEGGLGIDQQIDKMLAAARAARDRGMKVVVDISDNHFADPMLGAYWREVVKLATVCAVGSKPMAAITKKHTKSDVVVIGDPLGSPTGVPKVYSGGTAKLVWYGYITNIDLMAEWADRLNGDISFVLVTTPAPQIMQHVSLFNMKRGRMQLIPWSEEAQWAAVESADAVLIPSNPSDPRMAVKTANRLTDAINAGRHVIASPLPSYLPFRKYCDLTDDPQRALDRYLSNPGEALQRIKDGQKAVLEACSIEAISKQWLAVMGPKRSWRERLFARA